MADSVRETRTEAANSVRESRTLESGNGENPPDHSVRESLTHILHPLPGEVCEAGEPFNSTLNSTGGPFAERDDSADVTELRGVITGHWRKLRTAARRRAWAIANGVNFDAVHEYIIANSEALPLDKQVALVSAVKAENRVRSAGAAR
jgi:hypothetical protein